MMGVSHAQQLHKRGQAGLPGEGIPNFGCSLCEGPASCPCQMSLWTELQEGPLQKICLRQAHPIFTCIIFSYQRAAYSQIALWEDYALKHWIPIGIQFCVLIVLIWLHKLSMSMGFKRIGLVHSHNAFLTLITYLILVSPEHVLRRLNNRSTSFRSIIHSLRLKHRACLALQIFKSKFSTALVLFDGSIGERDELN